MAAFMPGEEYGSDWIYLEPPFAEAGGYVLARDEAGIVLMDSRGYDAGCFGTVREAVLAVIRQA